MTCQKFKKGFTLTELLITVSIMAMLIGGVSYYAAGSTKKSRDARRITEVAQIQTALNLYLQDHGSFEELLWDASTSTLIDGVCVTGGSPVQRYLRAYYASSPSYPPGGATNGRQPWSRLEQHLQNYTDSLPVDPRNGFLGWLAGGTPNYSHSTLFQGYYWVEIVSNVLTGGCGGGNFSSTLITKSICAGLPFSYHYVIETILEDSSSKFTARNAHPTLFNCIAANSPQSHRMVIWGL